MRLGGKSRKVKINLCLSFGGSGEFTLYCAETEMSLTAVFLKQLHRNSFVLYLVMLIVIAPMADVLVLYTQILSLHSGMAQPNRDGQVFCISSENIVNSDKINIIEEQRFYSLTRKASIFT